MGLTFDSAMDDAVDLLRKWVTVVRASVADIATFEKVRPKRSKRDQAVSRWQIYLGIMALKAAEGIAAIAPTRNVRAMIILTRSIFEYQQKAEFFVSHRREAYEQVQSIGARRYATLSRMARVSPDSEALIAAEFLEWRRTSGKRTQWSGNVAFTKMHLENAELGDIKVDDVGESYTHELVTAYGVPSLYAHGAAMLLAEVFVRLRDDKNWDLVEDSTYIDSLTALMAANAYLSKLAVVLAKAYGLSTGRLRPLNPQVKRTLDAVKQLHAQRA